MMEMDYVGNDGRCWAVVGDEDGEKKGDDGKMLNSWWG